jgi:hypothetical protein
MGKSESLTAPEKRRFVVKTIKNQPHSACEAGARL